MRWLLAGYCGLSLISVALNHNLQIIQNPRFYGTKTSHSASLYCLSSKQSRSARAQWYKATEYNVKVEERKPIVGGGRFDMHFRNMTIDAFLYIHNLHIEDSGVYFCKINEIWGPGTQLQVARRVNVDQALRRNNIKDGLIILQGLLLAVCIAAILLHKQRLSGHGDTIYEEPETDHIYEGLKVETCGGGLYEELSVYTQPDGAEAPWD